MIDATKQPSPAVVLHIAEFSSEPAETVQVEQWISQSGIEVARCSDVYLGLARALRSVGLQPAAVVVCVEGMAPEDFEFFTLLTRARRELPVLVYGARSPERIVRALQSGAGGLISRDAIVSLSAKLERRAATMEIVDAAPPTGPVVSPSPPKSPEPEKPGLVAEAPPPVAAPPVAPPSAQIPEAPAASPPPGAIGTNDDIAELPDDNAPSHTPSASGARVPWLRYNGGPERQRPPTGKKQEDNGTPEGGKEVEVRSSASLRQCDEDRDYEPLLTEQELAALLGDDLDDLSLHEREMLTGEGEVPGSGTR